MSVVVDQHANVERAGGIRYKDVFQKGSNKSRPASAKPAGAKKVLTGDLMSELKGQSSFFKKIEAQVEHMGVRGGV